MLERYYPHLPAVVVEPGVRTGVPLLNDNPKEVGADRIVNALAAYHLYGGPAIVVDFGTSTNFDVVSAKGEFVGGALAPGIEISIDALAARAARLRKVELIRPRSVIGKNTVEALQSGILYGFAGQVDGLVRRIVAELGRPGHGHRDRRAGLGGHRGERDHPEARARPHAGRAAAGLRAQRVAPHARDVRQVEVLPADQRPDGCGPASRTRLQQRRPRVRAPAGSRSCGRRPGRPARRRPAPAGGRTVRSSSGSNGPSTAGPVAPGARRRGRRGRPTRSASARTQATRVVPGVVEQRQPTAGPQHPGDLGQRPVQVEPVERLPDGDQVDARVRQRQLLGAAGQHLGPGHARARAPRASRRRARPRPSGPGRAQRAGQLAGAGADVQRPQVRPAAQRRQRELARPRAG